MYNNNDYNDDEDRDSDCYSKSCFPSAVHRPRLIVRQTTTTVPATDTTVIVQGTSIPFAIADYDLRYFAVGGQQKGEDSGSSRNYFVSEEIDRAVLYQLNNPTSARLQTAPGEFFGDFQGDDVGFAVQFNNEADAEARPNDLDSKTRVVIRSQAEIDASPNTYTGLTCSISQLPGDLTCPLTCRVGNRAGDVNQAGTTPFRDSGGDMYPWYLGQPGARSDQTYITYAVTRDEGGRQRARAKYRGRIRKS